MKKLKKGQIGRIEGFYFFESKQTEKDFKNANRKNIRKRKTHSVRNSA